MGFRAEGKIGKEHIAAFAEEDFGEGQVNTQPVDQYSEFNWK